MHDCEVEVIMPSLSNIADTSPSEPTRLEDIALVAAESGAREVTDVYIGETAFILLVVRGPESARLLSAVDQLDEVSVTSQTLSVEEPDSPPQASPPPPSSPAASSLPPPTPSGQISSSSALPSPSVTPAPAAAGSPSPASATGAAGIAHGVPPLGLAAAREVAVTPAAAAMPPARVLPILRESAWVAVADPAGRGEQSVEVAGRAGAGASPQRSPPRKVVCKGLWVLFRPPPESSSFCDVMALTGRQQVSVILRERSLVRHFSRSSRCVEEAVAMANRQGASSNRLVGSKVVSVHVPLDLSFRHVTADGNDSRAFLTITARNTTSDAVLSVVPPYVNLAASAIVELDGDNSTAARTSGRVPTRSPPKTKARGHFSGATPAGATPMSSRVRTPSAGSPQAESPGMPVRMEDVEELNNLEPKRRGLSLEDHFIFLPEFGGQPEGIADWDDEISSPSDECPDNLSIDNGHGKGDRVLMPDRLGGDNCPPSRDGSQFRVSTGSNVARLPSNVDSFCAGTSKDDFGVFIPSFGSRSKQAISIGPREVFEFVFAIAPKTSGQPPLHEPYRLSPRLEPNQSFETLVSVAWSCRPRGSVDADRSIIADKVPLQREMSSGGVLATGQRSNAAIRELSIQWSPPSWREGVIMSFAGPAVAAERSNISVSVTIVNQTTQRLNEASLVIDAPSEWPKPSAPTNVDRRSDRQNGHTYALGRPHLADASEEGQLLPLRTVISVGPIEPGLSTTVRVPCVVLGRGCASLGNVTVSDSAPSVGVIPQLWRARTAFKTFVSDQCHTKASTTPLFTDLAGKRMTMITEQLSVIDL